jgi:hypothetical protein
MIPLISDSELFFFPFFVGPQIPIQLHEKGEKKKLNKARKEQLSQCFFFIKKLFKFLNF